MRTVLLKGLTSQGLVFFTNYHGAKGRELTTDPRCAVNFYWKSLERQIRVEGYAERIDDEANDAYYRSRPIQSQLSAAVSAQSSPISGRQQLELSYVSSVVEVAEHMRSKLANREGEVVDGELRQLQAAGGGTSPTDAKDAHSAHQQSLALLQHIESQPTLRALLHKEVQRPKEWGGFIVRPVKVEFWQDGAYRLHSRIAYSRANLDSAEWQTEFLAP